MNFFALDSLDTPTALLVATLVGIAFGFWLERAGFGSSRRLAAIFYFRDFAVLKVMFTAIVTALVGLQVLAAAGLVEVGALYRMGTFVWPQVVGGLLFGAGFVMGGWCPGTALVGLAAGRLDALVFLAGGMAGSLLFAQAFPALRGFVASGACGVVTLPESFGLSPAVVVGLVLAMAAGAFAAVERFGPKSSEVMS